MWYTLLKLWIMKISAISMPNLIALALQFRLWSKYPISLEKPNQVRGTRVKVMLTPNNRETAVPAIRQDHPGNHFIRVDRH